MTRKIITTVVLALLGLPMALAQEAFVVEKGKVLLDGYDPVAYFDNEVKKGSEEFVHEVDGRKLLFSSANNLARFKEQPAMFTPAYGGWCAIAMVDKTFVVPDYTLYKIQDGQLLFFSVRAFFNGLTQWNKDAEKHKVLADGNYMELFVN